MACCCCLSLTSSYMRAFLSHLSLSTSFSRPNFPTSTHAAAKEFWTWGGRLSWTGIGFFQDILLRRWFFPFKNPSFANSKRLGSTFLKPYSITVEKVKHEWYNHINTRVDHYYQEYIDVNQRKLKRVQHKIMVQSPNIYKFLFSIEFQIINITSWVYANEQKLNIHFHQPAQWAHNYHSRQQEIEFNIISDTCASSKSLKEWVANCCSEQLLL